jgi:hypothetical protein
MRSCGAAPIGFSRDNAYVARALARQPSVEEQKRSFTRRRLRVSKALPREEMLVDNKNRHTAALDDEEQPGAGELLKAFDWVTAYAPGA